ncbi:MAG: hypothetical protein GY936_11485 [Ignavibacteriae bacterium]|nr:hypothetical protein [Ignavibacteriota bacterium]
MSISKIKIKKYYSLLFIGIYSVFLLINFTHSHRFNIPSNNIEVVDDNESNETDNLLFVSGDRCLIHQFSSSVISSQFCKLKILQVVIIRTTIVIKADFYPKTTFHINSPHRAPPIDLLV